MHEDVGGFNNGYSSGSKFANEKRLKVAEINFLCVHKKLRRKNFAPVLIREVTQEDKFERRVAGSVYGWGGFAETVRESQVLAPVD